MSVVEEAVASAFTEYLARISLNPTREKKILAYAASVTGYMKRDERGLGKYVQVEPFIHGSYSYGTAVRPKAGAADYDLDMILPLSREFFERYGPREALGYVRTRLALNYGSVSQGNKCVRISNEDGFHVDLVPAFVPHGNTSIIQVVDRKQGVYVNSHPVAVTDWVTGLNRATSNRFSASVRIFKRWRDTKFGGSNRPKSLLLTVLAGRSIEYATQAHPDWRTLFSSPRTNMGNFVEATAHAMTGYLARYGPRVLVPGTDDNVAERWSRGAQTAFSDRLEYFVRLSGEANAATTRRGALIRWSKLLGYDFPSAVGN